MQHSLFWKFIIAFCSALILGLLGVVVVNVIVDPFYRFDLVTIPGINAQRYEFSSNARMGKAGAVCRIQPQSVIMGTSRAEVGLDPKHPGFGNAKTYNLALAGTGIGEMELTLRHATYASPQLKQLVIGLDFLMFNAYREEVVYKTEVLNFDANRLLLSPDETCASKFIKDADRLIGFAGLKFAYQTIKVQKNEAELITIPNIVNLNWWMALYDNLGFRNDGYTTIIPFSKLHGQTLFTQDDGATQEIYYIKKIWRASSQHRYCLTKEGQPDTMKIFSRLLQFARQSGLDVRFVINPIHARMLIAIQEVGLWPQYEDWKRLLVKTLSEESAESGTAPYPLWDFSGFNSITTENGPPANDNHRPARWFWEPSHYRKETGDLMLDRLLKYKSPERQTPKDFGMLLNASNIENWLAETRSASQKYITTHASEVTNLKKHLAPLFEDWTGANCGEDVQLVNKAADAIRKGDHTTAEALFNKARTIRKQDRQRAAEIGVPYREPDLDPLIVAAQQGIGIDMPLDNWQAYQERGNSRVTAGDLRGALKDYTLALKDSPPNPALYFLRGSAKMKTEDFKSAVEDFEAGLKLDPSNAPLKQMLQVAREKAQVKR